MTEELARLFPITMVVLDVLASIAYLWIRDFGRCVYWMSAAVLTASITWWIK